MQLITQLHSILVMLELTRHKPKGLYNKITVVHQYWPVLLIRCYTNHFWLITITDIIDFPTVTVVDKCKSSAVEPCKELEKQTLWTKRTQVSSPSRPALVEAVIQPITILHCEESTWGEAKSQLGKEQQGAHRMKGWIRRWLKWDT